MPSRTGAEPHKIIIDQITKLPVLTAGDGLPKLTSKEVHELLADFP